MHLEALSICEKIKKENKHVSKQDVEEMCMKWDNQWESKIKTTGVTVVKKEYCPYCIEFTKHVEPELKDLLGSRYHAVLFDPKAPIQHGIETRIFPCILIYTKDANGALESSTRVERPTEPICPLNWQAQAILNVYLDFVRSRLKYQTFKPTLTSTKYRNTRLGIKNPTSVKSSPLQQLANGDHHGKTRTLSARMTGMFIETD